MRIITQSHSFSKSDIVTSMAYTVRYKVTRVTPTSLTLRPFNWWDNIKFNIWGLFNE
jgi:hypothetical protein